MKLMKPIILMMTLGSVLVYASKHNVRSEFNYEFKPAASIQKAKTFNELAQRDVASVETSKLPAIQYVALNGANRERLGGEWEVMRIVSETGEEVFNAFQNENDRAVKVNFDLIRTSVIQIDKEEGQVYFVSLLTEQNTIALFKEYNGGYEILEARKVIVPVAKIEQRSGGADQVDVARNVTPDLPATDPSLNAELILEKALNPSKSAEVLFGDAISGSATIRGGSIERLSVSLHRGTPNEIGLEMSFAEINDGGQFETVMGDQTISGIVTNSANEGFRIRFATGPLQGAMLNFVTEEAFEEMEIQRENQEYERLEAQESPIAEEIRDQQDEFQNQRAVSNNANAGVTNNNYQPEQKEAQYDEEGYEIEKEEQYEDAPERNVANDEYAEEKYDDEYADEGLEQEKPQGQIQSEIQENGFEF